MFLKEYAISLPDYQILKIMPANTPKKTLHGDSLDLADFDPVRRTQLEAAAVARGMSVGQLLDQIINGTVTGWAHAACPPKPPTRTRH